MSFWTRLKDGLGKSAAKLSTGITDLFTKRKLDAAALEEFEELLITADLSPRLAAKLTEKLRKTRFDTEVSDEEIKQFLAGELTTLLTPVATPLRLEAGLQIVLVVGVNGNGKTTSIGKLAHYYAGQGRSVGIAAGDTFRAAAVEQLAVWATRAKARFYPGDGTKDAASVAFQSAESAARDGVDLLFIDTAGRLHNKEHLVAELAKIRRVLLKSIPEAAIQTVLVLDATTGLTALSQVEVFKDAAQLTGLIVTKLDGTAKGGMVAALADAYGLPVHAVGVGEGIEDLQPFVAKDFAERLCSIDAE